MDEDAFNYRQARQMPLIPLRRSHFAHRLLSRFWKVHLPECPVGNYSLPADKADLEEQLNNIITKFGFYPVEWPNHEAFNLLWLNHLFPPKVYGGLGVSRSPRLNEEQSRARVVGPVSLRREQVNRGTVRRWQVSSTINVDFLPVGDDLINFLEAAKIEIFETGRVPKFDLRKSDQGSAFKLVAFVSFKFELRTWAGSFSVVEMNSSTHGGTHPNYFGRFVDTLDGIHHERSGGDFEQGSIVWRPQDEQKNDEVLRWLDMYRAAARCKPLSVQILVQALKEFDEFISFFLNESASCKPTERIGSLREYNDNKWPIVQMRIGEKPKLSDLIP